MISDAKPRSLKNHLAWFPFCDELQKVLNEVGRWLSADGTLPDHTHSPSGLVKVVSVAGISFYVLTELLCPKLNIAGRSGCLSALGVAMPVATMDKQDGFPLRQHNVWRTR